MGSEPATRQEGVAVAPLLEVDNLQVEFATERGKLRAVAGVSWSVKPGEIVALVGESGCGKSVTALSIMRLLAQTGRIAGGRILFEGRDLSSLDGHALRGLRGRDISMIFQEPMSSLNPVLSVGEQLMEPLFIHMKMSRGNAQKRAIELLSLVGIADGERRLKQYPHHLSGGMRQRVMIAIGIACNPKLLIADEPTTALDVTIQAQILELMRSLAQRLNISLVIITHNLGIVARYADTVNVMYAGRIVEQGPTARIFSSPGHPYTMGLLRSVPRLDQVRQTRLATIEGMPPDLYDPPKGCRFAPRCDFRIAACDHEPALASVEPQHVAACHRLADKLWQTTPPLPVERETKAEAGTVLSVRKLSVRFPAGRGVSFKAVDDVSFDVPKGRTLGLVGESGCGKTTVGRALLRLVESSAGEVTFEGKSFLETHGAALAKARRRIQVVFQDPYSTLNPRMTVGQIVAEPIRFHGLASGSGVGDRVTQLLGQVGLSPLMAERYPHQLSGGQRQRVGIARALSIEPSFIVLDEPVSALDVSVQGQIVNLLDTLQRQLGITYLFIAHDLAVVRHIAHEVVVMYLGRVMEIADRDELYENALHPYTQALLDAAPIPDPVKEKARRVKALAGEVPSSLSPPPGCVFHTRCPRADADCRSVVPPLRHVASKHQVACIKV